jgi:hypothetical protein
MIEKASLCDVYTQLNIFKEYVMRRGDCFNFRFNFILGRSNFANEFVWQTDEMKETFLSPGNVLPSQNIRTSSSIPLYPFHFL